MVLKKVWDFIKNSDDLPRLLLGFHEFHTPNLWEINDIFINEKSNFLKKNNLFNSNDSIYSKYFTLMVTSKIYSQDVNSPSLFLLAEQLMNIEPRITQFGLVVRNSYLVEDITDLELKKESSEKREVLLSQYILCHQVFENSTKVLLKLINYDGGEKNRLKLSEEIKSFHKSFASLYQVLKDAEPFKIHNLSDLNLDIRSIKRDYEDELPNIYSFCKEYPQFLMGIRGLCSYLQLLPYVLKTPEKPNEFAILLREQLHQNSYFPFDVDMVDILFSKLKKKITEINEVNLASEINQKFYLKESNLIKYNGVDVLNYSNHLNNLKEKLVWFEKKQELEGLPLNSILNNDVISMMRKIFHIPVPKYSIDNLSIWDIHASLMQKIKVNEYMDLKYQETDSASNNQSVLSLMISDDIEQEERKMKEKIKMREKISLIKQNENFQKIFNEEVIFNYLSNMLKKHEHKDELLKRLEMFKGLYWAFNKDKKEISKKSIETKMYAKSSIYYGVISLSLLSNYIFLEMKKNMRGLNLNFELKENKQNGNQIIKKI